MGPKGRNSREKAQKHKKLIPQVQACRVDNLSLWPYLSGALNADTKSDSANDNGATLPRFTAEAMKANRILVDLLDEIGERKARLRPRSRLPGCSLKNPGLFSFRAPASWSA
jgi:hypothetical protein